jgi:hypothetical protein
MENRQWTRLRSNKKSAIILLAAANLFSPSVALIFLSIYHEALNMLAVKMPAHDVFVPVDYSRDLGDNLDVLMNKLLEKHPQLSD